MVTVTALLAGWQRKGMAMDREPSDWQIVLMAIVAAAILYPLLWVAMAMDGELFWPSEYEVIAQEGDGAQPLYTASPKREWVGLTDDEVNEFAAGCHLGNSVQGAIYKAQAKLKEKNA